ncbi:hypothetical protein HN371_10330 [Candidatus Poribacteria bacterium]|jgi:hypothetical protein|nr:hypothetical protein [Candidatus Poribacteria bacterium]MBT5535262.1 hypothetical protein [Candidatus Poribacteria bacterium]MBT5714858.1 hypothetical protein [Candidatus Poribacteria bacterium]MBT7807141.1 hypothetical protein [Candidatus Poribacteria bacterium]
MKGPMILFAALAPLLLTQACAGPDASGPKQLRKVTIRVDGMAEHNGVL